MGREGYSRGRVGGQSQSGNQGAQRLGQRAYGDLQSAAGAGGAFRIAAQSDGQVREKEVARSLQAVSTWPVVTGRCNMGLHVARLQRANRLSLEAFQLRSQC